MNQEKPHNDEEFIEHEKDVASGEVTPKGRLENQIRLATILFAKKHERNFDIETHEGRNKIMEFWTQASDGQKTYSEIYREIEEDSGFKSHPRFQGDIYKITVEDIQYYKENGILPLE
ncbi:hypothetical protein GW764_02585 [Candidatus Parcubacteria bacterium]|nr:hypothetical protein [Candidatus Parcubacteria bacterium]